MFIRSELDKMSSKQMSEAAIYFLQGTGFKSSADANRAIFREMDDLKRRLQEAFYARDFKTRTSPEQRATSGLKGMFDEIDETFLKNKSFFGGDAVEMYTELNSAMNQYLKTRSLFARFRAPSPHSPLGRSFQKTVNGVLANINKVGHSSSNNRAILTDYLNASENLQAKFAKYYPKEAAATGEALVKGKPGAPASALKEGFDDASRQALASIKRTRDVIERAKRNRNSMEAFEAITGQKIHLDEVGDDISIHLSGYSQKLDELAASRAELERLNRLRRAVGADTFEDAKMFAVETKELATTLQKL